MLESWESLDKSVRKDVLKKGTSSRKPTECAVCTITIENIDTTGISPIVLEKIFHTNILTEAGEKTIIISEANTEIDRKVERSIEMMVANEKSLITIRIAIPKERNDTTNAVESAVIKFEMTLERFEPYKPIWEWTPDEKYMFALRCKEIGVRLFVESRCVDAFHKFSKACKILITMEPIADLELGDLQQKINDLRLILYNNMASCQLCRNNYEHTISLCTKILQKDMRNVKALYRRGIAYGNLRDIERATADLKTVVSLQPDNSMAKRQYTIYNEKLKEVNKRCNDMIRRMFKM